MESPTSFVSTASSSGENFAYNMWNPLLELLFHEHVSSILLLFVGEFDLAIIALSCHFAVDLLCYTERAHNSDDASSGTIDHRSGRSVDLGTCRGHHGKEQQQDFRG